MISALQSHLDLAKERLCALPVPMDISGKQDSGVENDASSGEHASVDEYDVLRTPRTDVTITANVTNTADRSRHYKLETSSSADGQSVSNEGTNLNVNVEHVFYDNLAKVPLARAPSVLSSQSSFIGEFTDIRNSIVAELEHASCINTSLRNSLCLDMERPYSETEWLYQARDQSDQVADSIAQSYKLDKHRDNIYPYINSHLPRENHVIQIRRTRRLSSNSLHSAGGCSCHTSEAGSSVCDHVIPGQPRDSASNTPNSQQHAAILRYYSYRHMNDGFRRTQTYRINRDIWPPSSSSFRFRQCSQAHQGLQRRQTDSGSPPPPPVPPRKNRAAVYTVPNVVEGPRTVNIKDGKWPKDSFV